MKSFSEVDSFTTVAELQKKFFPAKVISVGSLEFKNTPNENCVSDSDHPPEEGYKCHRIYPLQKITSPMCALYNVVQEACAQQNVKWPVECQVLPDPVHHIEDWPLYPETFYQPSGKELRPQPVGDEMGRIVYQYYPTSTVNYFSRSCVGGNKQLNHDVRPPLNGEDDFTLQFESRFESGNLAKSVQISECYYELHLRADLYTARHTQWFYFSVSNMRKDVTYRFSIVNLSKGDSLYNHGMKPLMYSRKEAELHNVGWRRCGSNIIYFRNQDCDSGCLDSDDEGEEDSPSYTLTFNISFPHERDTVYLAHCFPYTYSLLQHHLLSIQNDPYRSAVCRQRVLCRSLAGNPVYILTITNQESDDENRKKRAVVLAARVHPGETPSSWIMKGAIDFLTSDHAKAIELRKLYVFKIIPMVNPDGVIVGNHRCSLSGRDLNRQYKMVVKEMFPAVWHAKAMVRRLIDEHGVIMFCDFHAHSRKHNIFLYGCENRRNNENHLREQIFPLLLYYNAGDKFSFKNCKFRVQRCKEGTARVVVWMMGVLHSYTLESTFGGASEGPRAGTHYSIFDFLSMGRQFCESLGEYFDSQPGKIKGETSRQTLGKISQKSDSTSSVDSDRAPPLRTRRKRGTRQPRKRAGKMAEKLQSRSRSDQNYDNDTIPIIINTDEQDTEFNTFKPLTLFDVDFKCPQIYPQFTWKPKVNKYADTDHVSRSRAKSSIDLNDEASTYIDRVGELMSTRLAVSDNEDMSVSFWELQNPSTQWEKVSNSGSVLNRFESQRPYFDRSGKLNILEPVIAKTRLHEPRVLHRSPKSSPTRYYSSISSSRFSKNSQSSKSRFGSERGTPILKKKKGLLKKTLSVRETDGEACPAHRQRRNSICIDVLPESKKKYFDSSLKGFKTQSRTSSKNTSPIPVNDGKKLGPIDKTDSLQILKGNIQNEKSCSLDIDEETLCADIADCDTLFMDIGAKETPQLKAARNLKGKLMKKKAQSKGTVERNSPEVDNENSSNTNNNNSTGERGEISTPTDGVSNSEGVENVSSNMNATKPKKKIKIVIGKRPKQKNARKKFTSDLVL